jgi:hypothetical protein
MTPFGISGARSKHETVAQHFFQLGDFEVSSPGAGALRHPRPPLEVVRPLFPKR